LVAVTLGIAAPVFAEGGSSSQNGPLRKLGRGVANLGTCPAELIRTPELVARRDGYIAAMSVGLLQGAWRAILRGTAGVFEIATFYLEIPEGFRPLVTPEFVWEHGDWIE
jgi:putative exosortase-associated protein (TIGR04073 family)